MTEAKRDSRRAAAAAKALIDRRDPRTDTAAILVTLDHAVATVLLIAMDGDARKAAAMLNEGLLPAVEERLMKSAAVRS